MSESHAADHGGLNEQTFTKIFGALVVFTSVSFGVYYLFGRDSAIGFLLILGVAFAKAALVASYFMHLVIDWRKVYIIIVPALILGPMLVIVLWPDMVLAWRMSN